MRKLVLAQVCLIPLTLVFTLGLGFAARACADTASPQNEMLVTIADFADRNCPSVPLTGRARNGDASAEVKAELPGLLKKITDITAKLGGSVHASDYVNVPQDKLAEALESVNDCRVKLITLLFNGLIKTSLDRPKEDSVTIIEAVMTQRGPRTGYNPDQYYVHGIVKIDYHDEGPYKTEYFTACLTGGDASQKTTFCADNSSFGLKRGTNFYNFLVYMPGGNEWRQGAMQVPIMVCILSPQQIVYFARPREDRYGVSDPVCSTTQVNF
jgi:hypothetical protein